MSRHVSRPDQKKLDISSKSTYERGAYLKPRLKILHRRKILNRTDLHVIITINDLLKIYGTCYATKRYFCEEAEAAPRTIALSFRKLRKLKILTTHWEGHKRVQTLDWTVFNELSKCDKEKDVNVFGVVSARSPHKSNTHSSYYSHFEENENTVAPTKKRPLVNAAQRRVTPSVPTPSSAPGDPSAIKARKRTKPGRIAEPTTTSPRQPRKESAMPRHGFFPIAPTKIEFAEEDEKNARALYFVIQQKGVKIGRTSLSKWAKYLALCRRTHGDATFADVFAWYEKNALKPYVPQALCGRSFHEKFAKIKLKMEKELNDPKNVAVTDEARRIAKDMEHIGWPKGSKAELPLACQITLTNAADFLARLRKYLTEHGGADRRVAEEVVAVFGGAKAFTTRWLRYVVNPRLLEWRDFSGSLTAFAWSPRSKQAATYGHEIVSRYCGRASKWDDLVNELYEE